MSTSLRIPLEESIILSKSVKILKKLIKFWSKIPKLITKEYAIQICLKDGSHTTKMIK